jgi:DNA polymerase IV
MSDDKGVESASRPLRRVPSIMHIDMDAFYAAVEQAHKPSLRGKPVVVGGVGLRGVVSTASYEARVFGIRSAIPTALARRLCPNAAYLYPRFGAYHAVSGVVMEVLRSVSPLIEPLSLDEAFVDLAATSEGEPASEQEARAVAERVRERIRAATGLTASVGLGTSKLIAKVASEARKPDGCFVVPAGAEQQWLDPLPVRALWGVGPSTADRLRRVGVATVSDLRELTAPDLVGLLGSSWGALLYRLARGIDERTVEASRPTKSVSVEDTYPHDLTDQADIRGAVTELAERTVHRMREGGHTARTVTVKARGHDFTTVTRSETLGAPTDDGALIRQAAIRLLGDAVAAATASMPGVRLLGVAVTGLADFAQGDLVAELDAQAEREARAGRESADERGPAGGDDSGGAGTAGESSPGGGAGDGTAGDGAAGDGGDGDGADGDGGRPAGAAVPAVTLFGPVPVDQAARQWLPGQDVRHAERGAGWVQGAGVGRVTVRFESPDSPPGRIGSFRVDDPALEPVDAAVVARAALEARARG